MLSQTKRIASALMCAAALWMVACQGDEVEPTPQPGDMAATPDMRTPDQGQADQGQVDQGQVDQGQPDQGQPDQGSPDQGIDTPGFPEPKIGQGELAQALARSPARCGMAEYAWITNGLDVSPDLIQGQSSTYRAELIKLLLGAAKVSLPREPKYDVRAGIMSYQTQDRGQLLRTSAMIAAPTNPPEGPLDILLVLHGTVGFNDACAPSKQDETKLLAAAIASMGYIVVAPDYIGLTYQGQTGFLHPYLVGEPTALASIDSARAAGKLVASGAFGAKTQAAPRVLVMGGSQGGHAALWVDRLMPYYGQELTLLGTVATVPPADLVGQMERALGARVKATANTIAFLGAASDWYGVRGRLSEVFNPTYDEQIPAALGSSCDPERDLPLGAELEAVFTPRLLEQARQDALATFDPWGCMARENGLTTTSLKRLGDSPTYAPGYGILYVLGEEDTLVHTPIEREAFSALCSQQQLPLQYLECAGASHTRATSWALPDILTYLDERAAGAPPSPALACMVAPPTRCAATP